MALAVLREPSMGVPQPIPKIAWPEFEPCGCSEKLEFSLRQIFETSPIPMWIYDLGTLRLLKVNRAAVQAYGYSEAEMLAMTVCDIRPPEDVALLLERIQLRGDQPGSYGAGQWQHRKRDGTIFPVEVISHRVTCGERRMEMIFAIDVTERVRAETEMAEQAKLAKLVAESADTLIQADNMRTGLQHCAELLNRYIDACFVRIWTLDDADSMLKLQASAGEFTTIDDRYSRIPLSETLVGRIAADGESYATTDFVHSPRVPHPAHALELGLSAFAGYPLRIGDRTVGVAAAFARHSLTDAAIQAFASVASGMAQFIERKHGEESLRNLAALVENTTDAIVMTTPDQQITFLNRGACRLLGLDDPRQAVGMSLRDLHPPSAWEKLEASLVPIAKKTGHWRGESQLRHLQTGELIDVLMNAFIVRDPASGDVLTLAGVIHDIRERREAEESLRRAKEAAESASRMKSEFLANMSHEIRTPMNGIIAMTELALGTELNAEQRDYLETVNESAASLLTILNEILDFSRIEAGKIVLEKSDFSVRETVEDALILLAAEAHQKHIRLSSEIADDVPQIVRGDAVRLRQILLNLAGNAIKFTAEGGVTVRVRNEAEPGQPPCLHFEVQDTGIGIPADKQQLIFEAFTQADGSMVRRFGGTGLGLTICSRLLELMQGRIWVNSEPGKGSTFHFTACFCRPSID